jgi:transcriptional regulator with XRE-family HTH domain
MASHIPMEDAKTTFGRRLRLIRKANELTLEQLGEAAGIGFKHVAAIERGDKTASFDAIDRLAKALNVQPYELFLPHDVGDARLHQSFKQLVRQLEEHGSPPLKQLLLILLPLLRQFEAESSA